MMRLGVGIVRRTWLEKKDVLNCLSYDELKNMKKARKVRPLSLNLGICPRLSLLFCLS